MLNGKGKGKTRWTREFKLRALALMEEATDVSALAAELGCRREFLYIYPDSAGTRTNRLPPEGIGILLAA